MDNAANASPRTAVEFFTFTSPDRSVAATASRFHGSGGTEEIHLIVHPLRCDPFERQLQRLQQIYQSALSSLGLDASSAVWRRFFCSDLMNQAAALDSMPFSNPQNAETPCAISRITQPPAGPAKAALWACHIHDPLSTPEKTLQHSTLTLRRDELAHHWTTGLTAPEGLSSAEQTRRIFEQYNRFLQSRGLRLADHAVRTWPFVSHIDFNYAGLVSARREFFSEHGLTAETHYIASTGIEGGGINPAAHVMVDAYAVSGLRPEQIEFLCAPENMCPTSRYGVTFERGTCVSYRDRRHLLISGTASIDSHGRIVHEGDIRRQFDRTFENVEALLLKKNASLNDMAVLLVYVRDPADTELVAAMLDERFGQIPTQLVAAPVCRPGWLIEAEGLAIVSADEPDLPAF